MRTTVASIVLGLPYILALSLFVVFSDGGTAQVNPFVWPLYLGALAGGYAGFALLLTDRDPGTNHYASDFLGSFWPYLCMIGIVEAEPRFRSAFDVLWVTRMDGPLLIQTLGLMCIPCAVTFATLQMILDPELGHVEVNLSPLRA